MEKIYGGDGGSTKPPKLKSLLKDVSPLILNTQNFTGRGFCHRHHHHLNTPKTPIVDPYASANSSSDSPNLNSPLIRYLSSSSGSCTGGGSVSSNRNGGGFLSPLPLPASDTFDMPPPRSRPAFSAPVKVEEDVIVMDGILVDSINTRAPKTGGGLRMKSTLTSLDSGGRLQPSLSSSSTVVKETNFYKTETCRSREEFSSCSFGSKGQFALGKEELRPSRFFTNTKLEAQPCKSFSAGVCAYGSKCRFLHNQVNEALPSMEASTSSKVSPAQTRTVSPIKQGSRADHGYSFTNTASASNDWCPLDDGIEVTLPSASGEKTTSKEDVDAHIQTILHGPSAKKRLPVFTEFCPE